MDQSTLADAPILAAARPAAPPLVSVCITCRTKGTAADAALGPALQAEIIAALAAQNVAAVVRPVQCLSVCQRPVTVAIAAPAGFTFIFGDLEGAAHAEAVARFVGAYAAASYGFVPWKLRPAALRPKIVARLPPAAWSPEDGRPPDQPAKEIMR